MPLTDVVWLVRDGGAWRIAKLGADRRRGVARRGSSDELGDRPDVTAERPSFAAEVAAFERRQRAREASYGRTVGSLRCKTTLTVSDPARDMNDGIHPAPRTSIAHIGRADLRSFSLGRSGLSLCLRFETASGVFAARASSRSTSATSMRAAPSSHRGSRSTFDPTVAPASRAGSTESGGRSRVRRRLRAPAEASPCCWIAARSLPGSPHPLSDGRPSLDRFGFGAAAVNVRLSTRRETHRTPSERHRTTRPSPTPRERPAATVAERPTCHEPARDRGRAAKRRGAV